jgi:glutamate--cysteine ligase
VSLSEAQLLDDLRQRLFSPFDSAAPRTIGIEVELIPVDASTRSPALPRARRNSTAAILSRVAEEERWAEHSMEHDPPAWTLSDGARISFEPGGQIEISSAPHSSASSMLRSTQKLIATIRRGMEAANIELVAAGVDPCNDIEAVPLQLLRERYTGMTRYFDSIGPSGVRMMRQTAAIQINLERGSAPSERWRLLNALAPYVVALFANSRSYAGKITGHASFRAHLWRTLDRSRTGLPYEAVDPARTYSDFAMGAKAMRSSDGAHPWLSFRDWMRTGDPTLDDWLFHLSTLFPEVRPKEFFELRSADSIDPALLAAPVVFIAGIVYDEESAARAAQVIGAPNDELLERAGRLALADDRLHRDVTQLAESAISGAERLGEEYLSGADIKTAREYFDQALRRRGI